MNATEDLVIAANQLISSIPVFGAFVSVPIAGAISYYSARQPN